MALRNRNASENGGFGDISSRHFPTGAHRSSVHYTLHPLSSQPASWCALSPLQLSLFQEWYQHL